MTPPEYIRTLAEKERTLREWKSALSAARAAYRKHCDAIDAHQAAPKLTIAEWSQWNGGPYQERRGERLAVLVAPGQAGYQELWDLADYRVVGVCGPFTELEARG